MDFKQFKTRKFRGISVFTLLVLLALSVGSALASYSIASIVVNSNHVTATVNSAPTMTLTINGGSSATSTLGDGSSFSLVATCSNSAFSGTVTFYGNDVVIGTATATNGVATFSWTPSVAGSYDVYAKANV
jgi:hypothetical protein